MNTLLSITVGPLQEHCYILADDARGEAIVFDPGAEAERILASIAQRRVVSILLTHAHHDHIGAVAELRAATGARVHVHPADAHMLGPVLPDAFLGDGQTLALGKTELRAVHTPGHTPGMVSFVLDGERAIVGDTLFEGGPGRTWCPDDFRTTLQTLQTVLGWPDQLECFPGHGPSFRLGDVRPRIEAFIARGHAADFFGDATWETTIHE